MFALVIAPPVWVSESGAFRLNRRTGETCVLTGSAEALSALTTKCYPLPNASP